MDIPNDFKIKTKICLDDSYDLLEQALQEESPVSIRLNPSKHTAMPIAGYEKVKWCDTGYYLPERPSFTFDPLFHAGCYYVQEASSMFLEQAVKQYLTKPVVCLDLCAAPGGKSTHLQSILPVNSLLVSNEVIHSRAGVLKENLIKWGSPYTIVTCNDPKDIGKLTHLFDVIVADLPCSGEGMFRKDKKSRNEWSVDHVRMCAARQRRIIHDVWASLKPGGLLVYSTCTFNREENEENIRHFIEHYNAEILPVSVEANWNICPAIDESFPMYRFYPHRIKGEGFSFALLKKPDAQCKIQSNRLKGVKGMSTVQNPTHYAKRFVQGSIFNMIRLFNISNIQLFTIRYGIHAIPAVSYDTYLLLSHHLRVLYAGILVGEMNGNEVHPSPALALSACLRNDAFPAVEMSLADSIRYLQKESLVLPGDVPRGFVVVKYRNTPLGFVKNIGTRANNLYPQEWKIRRKT
ncbi:MAG: rRNA cytosine-C5-methyltransferase [Tannerella sp.]|jgi:16S rRNA C967 or C1407 C5-methylase (RsmB/RsmF family)/NOL1/NOP2/fmu family ribosome biogenesis protein|nr:rRNA cytosine-C5-methyltransferase [Tannerella sp.]